ncbi:GNAT family N-acetyltransferase [Aspergillus brunneoviolaceus CBS 621.78]|uniref:Uncharacterized protein n=1 Tax=Aspergillus brunneoviolaceus CBS 621.78 TaxID=1450534 RepID=A0ACD1FSJ7_9EURO|nr:hypothetical protein BO95DRAFT_519144 [Aspergillus brunneoviolaceus CBS 621.78]RAH39948.1 hypothetical protein BO95DRAFT_519144 [Aspergillus brunneoviolaceus CBS 621.78]
MNPPEPPNHPWTPFAILTPRLIILPTPIAISSPTYRKLYASLHANPDFCTMGFGAHFPVRQWTDPETREVIQTRDIARCWRVRGMGDCAVGLRPSSIPIPIPIAAESTSSTDITILTGEDVTRLPTDLDQIEWVGYAGVRDGTTTSIPAREAGDPPLPPWEEMVEVRYGVAPGHWGKGIAAEAAGAVMRWAVAERGVRRFIAETERPNVRSARALEKLGFRRSGTRYWKEPGEVEWELLVV